MMKANYECRIINVTVTDDTLSVDLEDGRTIAVPIGWYPRLAYGAPAERANYQISGAGYSIHWPDLDEDLGVEGLLLGKRSKESQASSQNLYEPYFDQSLNSVLSRRN